MDRQLLKRLLFEVEHYHFLEQDDYGDATYDEEPTRRMCYKEAKYGIVKTVEGTETTSTLRLYLDGMLEINPRDKFVVDGQEYPVLNYQPYPGLRPGTGTTVVFL